MLPKDLTFEQAKKNYIKAANKAIIKVASKMGISTVQSYRGAQIFEAIGLSEEVIDKYFTDTASRIKGVGLEMIAAESLERHRRGFPPIAVEGEVLDNGGQYQWRRDGEYHMWNPDTVAKLQHAVRVDSYKTFKEFTQLLNDEGAKSLHAARVAAIQERAARIDPDGSGRAGQGDRQAIRHRRDVAGFDQHRSARESGDRDEPHRRKIQHRRRWRRPAAIQARCAENWPDGGPILRRSAIKQVASARFGVTAEYLINADELQIKMAQGAKPGEGGQLPGHKVDEYIGKIRHSTPGVGLISPPPHHDIYSIEDLAQLIHDLKSVNPMSRVSVKLVSEVGVGTVAAGVAKAKADHILVSGDSGGTGASPLTSIKYAGIPWEMGIAETQQILVMNGLRGRVVLQTDGQIKTGRDVAIALLARR